MRYDAILYFIGIICFILAIATIPLWGVTLIPVAVLIALILFGLFFMAYGYSARPRKYKQMPAITTIETKRDEEKPLAPLRAPSKPLTELTRIKGIGPKRIARLKALEIVSVEDLLRFSAEDLAAKLGISSKITAKWLEQAADLLKEPGAYGA